MRVYHHGKEYEWEDFVAKEKLAMSADSFDNVVRQLDTVVIDYWINLDTGDVALDGAQ